MKIKGRVLKFGDNINTTLMWPIERVREGEDIKPHVLETVRPGFYKEVKPGDVIVAGTNWGCGSHRMGATSVLKEFGISAIVADSIARIYYRNCISIGLPAVVCKGVSKMFNNGDEIEVNVETGDIRNLTTGKTAKGAPLPEVMMNILKAGGIIPLAIERLKHVEK